MHGTPDPAQQIHKWPRVQPTCLHDLRAEADFDTGIPSGPDTLETQPSGRDGRSQREEKSGDSMELITQNCYVT